MAVFEQLHDAGIAAEAFSGCRWNGDSAFDVRGRFVDDPVHDKLYDRTLPITRDRGFGDRGLGKV